MERNFTDLLMHMMMVIIKSIKRCSNDFHQYVIRYEIYTQRVDLLDLRVRFVGRAFRHADFPHFSFRSNSFINSCSARSKMLREPIVFHAWIFNYANAGYFVWGKKKREVKIPVLCANYPSAFGCEMKEVEMKRIECMFGIVFNVWTWIYLRKKLHVKLRIITFSSVIKAGNECAEEGGNEDPNLHKVIY